MQNNKPPQLLPILESMNDPEYRKGIFLVFERYFGMLEGTKPQFDDLGFKVISVHLYNLLRYLEDRLYWLEKDIEILKKRQ